MNILAEAIAERRKRLDWGKVDLAAKAGVTRQTVGAIERGKLSAELGGVLALIDALGLEIIVRPKRTFATEADYLEHLIGGDRR